MAPRALVTGPTGFVGRRLVKLLCDRGWEVRGLVLPSERSLPLPDARMTSVVGDVTDGASLRGTMDGVDAVFHLAARVTSWLPKPEEFYRVNVGGTDNVIDEALRARVPRFVFTSSLSGIGVHPGEMVREDSPPGKVFGDYEESKALAERHVAKAFAERGLPAVVLIPAIILGPGDTRNTGKLLLDFVQGRFPGTFAEDSVLPVVDVDDVAKACLLAYERGKLGARYIICGENARWGDLMRIASEVSGTPMPSRHIGSGTLWLVSRAGEIKARVTRRSPRLPAWLSDFMATGAQMDHTRSVEELGMTYLPVSESIRRAVAWFTDAGLAGAAPHPAELPELELENSLRPLEGRARLPERGELDSSARRLGPADDRRPRR